MSSILGVQTVFPEHRYSQKDAMSLIKTMWPDHEAVIDRLTDTSGVKFKNLILPLEGYRHLGGFEDRNKIYIESMIKLLKEALTQLQDKHQFSWDDVMILTSTSVTGVAVPTLDARLMNLLPIPRTVIRVPLFGVGCLGGVAGLNRTHDMLKAHPKKLGILLAAEACSLTFQFNDVTMSNMVATSLFGDGAAAVLMAGDDHPLAQKGKLRILTYQNSFYPQTERIMGWDMLDSGFKVVLSGDVAQIVNQYVGDNVTEFLKANNLSTHEIVNIISHPGGPKVLKALEKALHKEESALKASWESLSENGNISSVSVLDVMRRNIDEKLLKPGPTLALAMGPAFNSEMTLMRAEF